ncbi:hypothetical protein ACFQAT_18080 [Undibacterium arcticum]|uniref:Elongation factor P C-terminal domain-containing protein n=1 Tax=Undibacterium arcticum TaxID=1762892 RepID=A0ABV7F7D7_9BURK
MTNERDLIVNLTLAVIDLAGAVAQIAETMPEHTKAQINDSLFVEQGDKIEIDTRTGEYKSRSK